MSTLIAVITLVVACCLLTWSSGSADDVIVSTAWLYERLSSVFVLEATYTFTEHLTNVEHIPGASLWDLRQCSWPTSTRPRNNPEELCLQLYACSLGIDNQTPVVIYDRTDMQDAARTWWTLSILHGRQNVVVLDGGWTEWTRHSLPTTFGRYRQFYNDVRGNWVAKYKPSRSRNLAQMTADVRTGLRQVVDTRLPQHYRGDDVEPCQTIINELSSANVTTCRRMLRGHMLSAVSVPWPNVIDPESGRLLDRRRLLDVFQTAGVDVNRPLTTTSYVGNSACLVALAAVHCGAKDVVVYLGSWTEWAQLADSRLVVRGEDGIVPGGHCPHQWKSSKTAFMTIAFADTRKSATNCDEYGREL